VNRQTTLGRVGVTFVVVEKQLAVHVLGVFLALFIQHVLAHSRCYCIVVCGLSVCTQFFHIIS